MRHATWFVCHHGPLKRSGGLDTGIQLDSLAGRLGVSWSASLCPGAAEKTVHWHSLKS